MVVWEARELKKLVHKGEHNGQLTDLQKNVDGTMVISSCKDNRAMLWDADSLELLKTYTTGMIISISTFLYIFT